jgi:hypothetical protein
MGDKQYCVYKDTCVSKLSVNDIQQARVILKERYVGGLGLLILLKVTFSVKLFY